MQHVDRLTGRYGALVEWLRRRFQDQEIKFLQIFAVQAAKHFVLHALDFQHQDITSPLSADHALEQPV